MRYKTANILLLLPIYLFKNIFSTSDIPTVFLHPFSIPREQLHKQYDPIAIAKEKRAVFRGNEQTTPVKIIHKRCRSRFIAKPGCICYSCATKSPLEAALGHLFRRWAEQSIIVDGIFKGYRWSSVNSRRESNF